MITGSGYESFDDAMRDLKKRASQVDANALVEISYIREKYDQRTFMGRPVNVGKCHPAGTKEKADFQSLNETLERAYKKERQKQKNINAWNLSLWLLALCTIGFLFYAGIWPLSAAVIIVSVILTVSTTSWLIEMPNGASELQSVSGSHNS